MSEEEVKLKKKQGFATWSPEKQREASRKGGKAAHAKGVAHRFTKEEAQIAGRKGGSAHSRKHVSEIGRLGGVANGHKSVITETEETENNG